MQYWHYAIDWFSGLPGWGQFSVVAPLGALLLGTGRSWVEGFIKALLPSNEGSAKWLKAKLRGVFVRRPAPDPTQITLLIAALADDPSNKARNRLVDAFTGARGFRVLMTERRFDLGGANPTERELAAEREADALRQKEGADLLLWGKVAGENAYRVWFTGPGVRPEMARDPFRIKDDLLEPAFHAEVAQALQIVALAAVPRRDDARGRFVADQLRARLPALENLLATPPPGFDAEMRRSVAWAVAEGTQTLGEQAGDNAALAKAAVGWQALLDGINRAEAPLEWAATQNNLGNALSTLGEREGGTVRLEAAVVAYRAALEERRRDRVPLQWAMTQNNLGDALARLVMRGDAAALPLAIAAFEGALEEYRRAGADHYITITEENLARARALRPSP